MTRLLASVTGPAEADIAIAGGADLIDLKDPGQGALGAVSPDVVADTVRHVAGRRETSAVAGDLPMEPAPVLAAATAIADSGSDYAKVGIFPGGDPHACITALSSLGKRTKLVAVLFADSDPDLALLPALHRAGFAGAMLDTRVKGAGRLLDHMDLPRLRRFVDQCRALALLSGLAGSLELPDVPRLLVLSPDFLGFRGALCGKGGRATGIELIRVQAVRALIPQRDTGDSTSDVDYRLLAARGYAPGTAGEDLPTDLVFVHDLVLPVSIGAYAHEHGRAQNVRFDIEASVLRAPRSAEDMRDVFSYDVITDGIRILIASGHVSLVETLAERIAAMLLDHPRIVKVAVAVEKLDTGQGRVGVRIERTRPATQSGRVVKLVAEGTAP